MVLCHKGRIFAAQVRYNSSFAMRPIYIWQQPDWPHFCWDASAVGSRLSAVRYRQGVLAGELSLLGFDVKDAALLDAMTADVCSSAAIEGVFLDGASVRSSVARHLGLSTEGLPVASHYVEGIVEVLIDAVSHATEPVSSERLCGWHAALFPTGRSGLVPIGVGRWREGVEPMQVVSGAMGKERVHYEAPPSAKVAAMMSALLSWVNEAAVDDVLKAAVSHLWFVSIHPFDDGNGRMARTLSDLLMTRSDGLPHRFYSLSAAILNERKAYYAMLERAQHGSLDITAWVLWFLDIAEQAIGTTESTLARTLEKGRVLAGVDRQLLNARQWKALNRLLDGFEGKFTSSKYAKVCHCSSDTALRDLRELMAMGILRAEGEGRGTHYLPAHS